MRKLDIPLGAIVSEGADVDRREACDEGEMAGRNEMLGFGKEGSTRSCLNSKELTNERERE